MSKKVGKYKFGCVKKNTKKNQDQNTKGYQNQSDNNMTDSVQNDNGSHAENRSDSDCQ